MNDLKQYYLKWFSEARFNRLNEDYGLRIDTKEKRLELCRHVYKRHYNEEF